ncbi:MAG: glycosyltransferase family 2 protein, partial [Verrucomicrobiota bacterium]|nr:glycosyltransferase family 2 protein [Verrucomicrobiota bacterium]
LAEAIESVRAQDYAPIGILVIDDQSTDRSAEISRSFPDVTLHHQTRAGAGAARNRGVDLARGELLAFLDADDVWLPGKLSAQFAALDDETEAVFTQAVQFREGQDSPPLAGYFPGTMLIRREAFLRVGLFATDRAVRETFEWQARAVQAGLRSKLLPEVFYRRRIHSENRGLIEPNLRGYLEVLRDSIERRRQAEP